MSAIREARCVVRGMFSGVTKSSVQGKAKPKGLSMMSSHIREAPLRAWNGGSSPRRREQQISLSRVAAIILILIFVFLFLFIFRSPRRLQCVPHFDQLGDNTFTAQAEGQLSPCAVAP